MGPRWSWIREFSGSGTGDVLGLDVDHRESRDPKGGVEGPETMRVSCVGPRIIGGVGGVTASRLEEAKESENKGGLTGLNDIG